MQRMHTPLKNGVHVATIQLEFLMMHPLRMTDKVKHVLAFVNISHPKRSAHNHLK
jgi:hypothetical protein